MSEDIQKISDFGLSKILDILSISMNIISQKGLKGTPLHMAPEILINEKYSKSSDIYAFAYIVYEIVTGKVPFSKMGIHQIYHQIAFLGTRPVIDEFIPMEFGELIEKCWSKDPDKRPAFDQIVDELKNCKEFVTETIDEVEFYDYVDFIDDYQSTFDKSKQLMHFDEFIMMKGRNKSIQKVNLFNKSDDY